VEDFRKVEASARGLQSELEEVMAIAEEKDKKYSLVQASLKKLTAAHADFIEWKVNKRLANVEQVGAPSAKTAEEQQVQLQQLKSELSAVAYKWRMVADVYTKLEVAGVSALGGVVLENKERLQNAEEELQASENENYAVKSNFLRKRWRKRAVQ
jgi:PDZ domain-containing secreted protein